MKRIQQSHLPVHAFTHPGMRGKNNEDRLGVTAFLKEDGRQTPVLLAVISDGIGGHRAGEVAAELAVNKISAYVAENGDRVEPTHLLQAAIRVASQTISEQARNNRAQEGMGATCACVYVVGNHLYTASVGDLRIYLLRDGYLHQLTTDHTWIQEALARGIIHADEVRGHPNAHVIRQFLGSPYPPLADIRLRLDASENDEQAIANQGVELEKGDILLLTTDGLTDLVTDEEIARAFIDSDCDTAARSMIDLANQRGGHDNITVIALQAAGEPVTITPRPNRSRTVVTGCLALLIVVALTGLVIWGVTNWQPDVSVVATPSLGPKNISTRPAARPGESQTAAPGFLSATPPPVQIITSVFTALPTGPSGVTLTPWPTNTP